MSADAIELDFELDPLDSKFRGDARYALQLDRRRRSLELHAVGLRVVRVRLYVEGEVYRGRVEQRPESETIALHFERLIPSGSATLELGFRGRVRRDLRGLYRAGNDDEAWLASQLCPTDARRFFPCLDEPGMKARYRIRVTAPAHQAVLSNAPIEFEEQLDDGRKIVHFESTPPLSSYLIAVAVGPFEASAIRISGTTAIRVHSLPGRQDLTAFACEAAAESLERLERWFDMPHPYPKLDLVALPAFAFGAMENAGAVFFRDSILLLDASEANAEDRKRASEVIAHELSHMWFGNLVTMCWWNDLWLNEAFATWMAYEIVDSWRPEWRIWLDFGHRREHALEMDALMSSHPIAPPIRSAEQAHENFDAITYTKGASVLRMLERYLGREVFRDGIRLYIRRHREANAEAADLWTALSEVSGEPIEAIVSPWTLQTGYPLISVRRRKHRGQRVIELGQDRFLALAPRGKRSDPTRWTIPWVGRIGQAERDERPELRLLLSKRRARLPSQAAETTWIYGNASEAGFFRIDHGRSEYQDLLANLSSLSRLERIGLVGNQWALAQAGRAPIESLLELLAQLGGVEEDPDVLAAVEAVLLRLCRRLAPSAGPQVEARLRSWIGRCFGDDLDRVGPSPRPGEAESELLRRARLLSISGGLAQTEEVIRECARLCARHFAEGTSLTPELAAEIIQIAAGRAGSFLHAALRAATRKAKTPQARRRYFFALAEFTGSDLIQESLDAAFDGELAPAPDRAQLIALLLTRRETAMPTWSRLQKVWKRLERELPPILLARLAGATAEALPTDEAAAIRAFFDRHPLAAGSRVLSQIAEQLEIARRLERSAGPALTAYLGG